MKTGGAASHSIAALVLAAGAGSRFGGGKLLAPFQGAPLLHAALAAARAAPVGSITVVTGADAALVAAAARAFDPTIRLVHAADHAEGMAASLRAGIASLDDDAAAAFVFLGDMPRVPHAVLAPLAQAVAAGAAASAPVFQGRRGNPVVLARALFGEVAALTGDVGARPILQRLGAGLALVEAPDDGVLFDVDARADLSGQRPVRP
ncbi:NTP transferase domain-containing protein [Phenylobacterium sp.]|uniref:nucleotidyltransferase family protein n=1 Tax=Phenylobacterium sp. TaxID=1871053 RepID=UPI0025D40343|nr:NTP transferase domain-containing protein [Phenylobacterium sp.]